MKVIPIAAATLFHVFVKSPIFPGSHTEFIKAEINASDYAEQNSIVSWPNGRFYST